MAQAYKVLAQSAPSATTLTDVYTVPSATSSIISSIVVANRSGSARTFRLSVAIAGAADTAAQYIAYDMTVPANDSVFIQLGVTLATTDKLRAYVSAADVSINVFGVENS